MVKSTCKEEPCARPVQARGLCSSHYGVWYKNNRPREAYRPKYEITCMHCQGKHMSTRKEGKYCSLPCRDKYRKANPLPPSERQREQSYILKYVRPMTKTDPKTGRRSEVGLEPPDLRAPLRRAVEDGGDVIGAVQDMVKIAPSGCWRWQGRENGGYPVTRIGRAEYGVHRLVLEAKHGKPLGKQAAHHICANSICVNPDHLQPVTHRDNNAEMLARTFLFDRVARLEEEIRRLDPANPLLHEISIPK